VPRSTHRSTFARSAVAVVAALSLSTGAACSDEGEGPGQPPSDIAYDGAYTNQLLMNLQDYDDQRVRITGEVRRVVSPYTFTLGEPDVDPVLVVVPDGSRVRAGDRLQVTGRAHLRLHLPTVEKQVGRDIDDKALAGWGEEPYVMAESLGEG
jgi:hypothetical protein